MQPDSRAGSKNVSGELFEFLRVTPFYGMSGQEESLAGKISVDPRFLQIAAAATPHWNEFVKGLALWT